MKAKIKIHYSTSDGQKFESEEAAIEHEENLFYQTLADDLHISITAAKFISAHGLPEAELFRVAYWSVPAPSTAEDAMYRRHNIKLGIVRGSFYKKAVNYAVTKDAFLRFIGYGSIKEVDIIELPWYKIDLKVVNLQHISKGALLS